MYLHPGGGIVDSGAITLNQFQTCLVQPDKYDRSPGKCKGFLMNCAILLASAQTKSDKIHQVLALLIGRALPLATVMFNQSTHHQTFPEFE